MWGSFWNVVGLTRPYALPLTALFWAQIPDLRSMTSLVIFILFFIYFFFSKIGALSSAGQRHLYTAHNIRLNRL
jgi:hypothetical protein